MPDQASNSEGKHLMQIAANAKCFDFPIRAWHSIFVSAISVFSGSSLLPHTNSRVVAVPLAMGKRAYVGDVAGSRNLRHTSNSYDRVNCFPRSRSLHQSAVIGGKT
jgi:hypothetical protein